MKSSMICVLVIGLVGVTFAADPKIGACEGIVEKCCSNLAECKTANPPTNCESVMNSKEKFVDFKKLTNDHFIRSFEYLFLSAQFGTHVKQRPGFEKILHGLADSAWSQGIENIKQLAKLGVKHSFDDSNLESKKSIIHGDRAELESLGIAVDIEKALLKNANNVHKLHQHSTTNNPDYDSALAHFLEEKIIEDKTETVRNLVGLTNNLKNIVSEGNEIVPMSLYLFDQILQK